MSKIMELVVAHETLVNLNAPRDILANRAAIKAEVECMEAEIAALRVDAERYRWLREQNANPESGFYVGDETDALPEDITWVGSDLDAAIDSARGVK